MATPHFPGDPRCTRVESFSAWLSVRPAADTVAPMKSLFRLGLSVQLTLVVLGALAAYVGVMPAAPFGAVPHLDFFLHVIMIGGLAFFLDGTLEHRALWRGRGSLAGALVLGVAGIEEWAQRLSPRRSSTISDFVADTLGVVFFVWLARRVGRTDQRRNDASASAA